MKKALIAKRLKELEDKHGRLTPDIVITDAKKKASPLHGYFDWNVKRAALSWWREQARDLIASVRVEVKTEHYNVRAPAYVEDPSKGKNQQGYVSVVKLRDDKQLAREALVAEFTRVAQSLDRAHAIAKALDLENEVESLRTQVDVIRKNLEVDLRN